MSEAVRSMFADISGKYDFMNTVLTFGLHHSWRRKAVRLSGVAVGMDVLDCASGTGDLALEFKRAVGASGNVTATDFCREMLDYIPAKAQKDGLEVHVEFADAMNLQYSDNCFDVASISYGIRNVDDPITALKQMARVVKNGGKLVVIETGQPEGIMKIGYLLYSKYILPTLGKLLSGNNVAYSYLPKTAHSFPYGSAFVSMMQSTNLLTNCTAHKLLFGASYIYIATVNK